MATEIKLATQPMAAGPWRTVYECPAGKTAIVKSCIAANTGEAITNMPATLAVRRGAVTTAITGAIGISTNSSVNLLAGTLTMQAGDQLVTYTQYQSAVANKLGLPPEMGGINSMRARGTTLIAATSSGLWRTTDLATWTRVYAGTSGTTLLNIGTTWFNYTSITTALRSTDDGLTWASIAVTNAPTQAATLINGGIIAGHSGRYAGQALSGVAYLTTSADGITWTLATATPQAIASDGTLARTGTHYITVRASGGSDIYRSVDGTSWATVTLTGMGPSITSATSNGAGTVVVTGESNITQVSTDHGATFASASVSSDAVRAAYTGAVFLVRIDAPESYAISATGLPGSWVYSRQMFSGSLKYATYGTTVINSVSGGLQVSTDLSLTQSGAGLSATASLMEVTAA